MRLNSQFCSVALVGVLCFSLTVHSNATLKHDINGAEIGNTQCHRVMFSEETLTLPQLTDLESHFPRFLSGGVNTDFLGSNGSRTILVTALSLDDSTMQLFRIYIDLVYYMSYMSGTSVQFQCDTPTPSGIDAPH